MEKCIALLRVSGRRQQKRGYGLAAQRTAVDNFSTQNGKKIVEYFIETKSGLSVSRPVLDAVIAACRKYNARLLIPKIDRLSRRLLFVATLMESDIKFTAVDKPYADEYELHMEAANAQRESRLISKRTKAALAEAKTKGVKLGTAVYKLHRKQRKAFKKFVCRIKNKIKRYWFGEYNSVRKLVAILNKNHVKTFSGGDAHWHYSTVYRVLKTLKYL